MKKSQKIAVGGLMTAFSVVLMLMSNFIPSFVFVYPAMAGIALYVLSFTSGQGYAWTAFGAVSLLSLFVCMDKTVPLCFMLLLGYYPMIKKPLEKLRSKVLSYAVKLAVFNAAAVSAYLLLTFVFSVALFERWTGALWMRIGLLIGFNVIFLLYDLSITMFFRRYENMIYNFVTKIFKRF